MDGWERYVTAFEAAYQAAQALDPAGDTSELAPIQPVAETAPLAVLFSPHPDDEALVGALPLRLRQEAGWRVLNVAVTLGSDKARQSERLEELQRCCAMLGFDLLVADACGLERVTLADRRKDPHHWTYAVGVIARLLLQVQPQLILFPHSFDGHPTHIGTHALVRHAMERLKSQLSFTCAETDYWAAMEKPNVLVESSATDVARLVAATAQHQGEVARNPYHLRLPAWLMDNVRRGAEVLFGARAPAPDLLFGTLYHLRQWRDGRFQPALETPQVLTASQAPDVFLDVPPVSQRDRLGD